MTNDPAAIAAKLTKAQLLIIGGHLADIPPEDAHELEEWGLKGQDYWHEENDGSRRLIWPITALGLSVRAHLKALKHEGVG